MKEMILAEPALTPNTERDAMVARARDFMIANRAQPIPELVLMLIGFAESERLQESRYREDPTRQLTVLKMSSPPGKPIPDVITVDGIEYRPHRKTGTLLERYMRVVYDRGSTSVAAAQLSPLFTPAEKVELQVIENKVVGRG
jgi:hypothetical protein